MQGFAVICKKSVSSFSAGRGILQAQKKGVKTMKFPTATQEEILVFADIVSRLTHDQLLELKRFMEETAKPNE